MIVVHAIWSRDSRLCLWGEDSSLLPGLAAGRDAQQRHRSRAWCRTTTQTRRSTVSRTGTCRSFPSPPARALPPAPVAAVVVGDSLRFVAEAAKLALELVARGRLRAGLVRRGDEWTGRWLPMTDDPHDAARVEMLHRSMPAAVRAQRSGDAPEAVTRAMLGAVVDACARTSSATCPRRSRCASTATSPASRRHSTKRWWTRCSRRRRESRGSSARGSSSPRWSSSSRSATTPPTCSTTAPTVDGRSGKLARLEEILQEALAQGDRALCFTQFATFGHQLRAHLQERLGREVLAG